MVSTAPARHLFSPVTQLSANCSGCWEVGKMSALVAGGSPETRRRRARGYHADRTTASPDADAVRVKVETDVDIKDYAENTMNELLGWYGYDKLDTRGLNLKNLNQNFPTSSSSSSPMRHDDDLSEEDTGRSRSPNLETESISNASGGTIICAWCLKTGLKLFTLKTSSGKTKAFCSEPCFNQCRRAAFKKNRVCNWCRHVRHTVNYVDFKDGDDQLQFCSDKCLNQYKMQIFCKETQAYLQMNPHLQEESSKQLATASSKLITPDLWLRDCHESLNGGGVPQNQSHSDDEPTTPNLAAPVPKSTNGTEIEDLTHPSKSERCSSSVSSHERELPSESRKSLEDSTGAKDKRSLEMCNALASYLSDDRDKNILDRKKRYYDSEKDNFRKRQRISSMRHKTSHHAEAPPAHISSTTHSSLSLQNQNRLFQASQYQPPLSTGSPPSLNPPAAHTKAIPPHHPPMTAPLLPPGLPPPPPLLNNEFIHSPFGSSFFPPSLSPQQHLDAVLRMQSGMRQGDHFPPHLFQESMMPLLRNAPAHHVSNSFMQPNTVMLPYPVFIPLPVPIPIPLPLSSFLPKDKKQPVASDNNKTCSERSISVDSIEHVNVESDTDNASGKSTDSTKCKNSKVDISNTAIISNKKHTTDVDSSSYAVTNNDSQTNRLILTRNKTR